MNKREIRKLPNVPLVSRFMLACVLFADKSPKSKEAKEMLKFYNEVLRRLEK